MWKKTFLAFAVAFVAVLLMSGVAAAADSVGVIDSQKILFQHPHYDAWCLWLLGRSRELESREQADVAAESQLEKKLEIVRKRGELMQQEEARVLAPIHQECYEAVAAVAKQKKITVVLEQQSSYFGGADITEEVVLYLKSNAKTTPPPKSK